MRKKYTDSEHEELVFIGQTIALRPRHRAEMSNEKSSGKRETELTFAPVAAALIMENETGEESTSLANAGYNPDEARIPGGQPAANGPAQTRCLQRRR